MASNTARRLAEYWRLFWGLLYETGLRELSEKERREDELWTKSFLHKLARNWVDDAFKDKNVGRLRDLAAGEYPCDRDYAQSMFNRLLEELNGPIPHQETLKFPEE